MTEFLTIVLNYIWVFIKLFIFCAFLSLPFIGATYIFKSIFSKLNKKYSYVVSLFLCIFGISYIIILLLYFIPILNKFAEFTFLDAIGFILFHIARLIIVTALFSAVLLIIGMFVSLMYENSNKSKKVKLKRKKEVTTLSFFNLWKSFTIVLVVVTTFILIVFPKLPVIILYLIYM